MAIFISEERLNELRVYPPLNVKKNFPRRFLKDLRSHKKLMKDVKNSYPFILIIEATEKGYRSQGNIIKLADPSCSQLTATSCSGTHGASRS